MARQCAGLAADRRARRLAGYATPRASRARRSAREIRCQVIDFHAHLDLYPDPLATTRECIERDLFVLSVTTTPSAWSGTAALAKDAPRIRTAIGLHPQIAQERQHELPLFEELLPRTRYVGEVGLDGAPELKSSWGTQQRVSTVY
jgi:TatD DNase family protein